MLALLSLILALALLFAIVMILHRHQQRALSDAAEREQSLPPLELDSPVHQSNDVVPPEVQPKVPADVVPEVQTGPDDTDPPVNESVAVATVKHADWKSASQALKDNGEYEVALLHCREAWPQWQSYQQAAVVIRAALKQKGLTEQSRKEWLARLYHMACEASFLHDKVDGLPSYNWQKLAELMSPEQLSNLETPWQELGCGKLRLLTKTDCSRMVKEWGEPAGHMSVKEFHQRIFTTQSGY